MSETNAAPNQGLTNDTLIPYSKNGLWGYCNTERKVIIPCKYHLVSAFSEGLGSVCFDERFGFINATGKMVIPRKFDFASSFFEGLAAVSIKGKFGYIDKAGSVIIPADFNFASDFEGGVALIEKKGKMGYVNKAGKIVVPCKYDAISTFKNGVAIAEIGGKEVFIDLTGKETETPPDPDFRDGLCPEYSEEFDAYGFINEARELVVPHTYEMVNDFSEGLAGVCDNGLWGFINTKGEMVIEPKYADVAMDFREGLALVFIDDEELGYIDAQGNEYWD